MNTSAQLRLIQESRAAGFRIIASFAIAVFGFIWWLLLLDTYSDNQVIIALLLFASGMMSAVINSFVFTRIGVLLYDDDAPPAVTFETTAQQPPMRIEVNQDSLTRLGRFRLTRQQWQNLAEALADSNWRWTRANVGKAGVFVSLTKPGVYPELTDDFERLGVVDNGYVTRQGREKICAMAGMDVVI